MKKILLCLSVILATAACAPKPTPQQQFAAVCIACMIKAQLAEGAVKACPKQVKVANSAGYRVFSKMSRDIYGLEHANKVDMFRQAHKQDGCPVVVNAVQTSRPSYEFLTLR